MSVVYGCDPGLKNCAFVKLVTNQNSFSIEKMEIVDISDGMDNFYTFFKKYMLEEGDTYIEYQYRQGRTKDMSHHIHGYLTAMMNKRIYLKQSRDKFKVAIELGIMPKDHGDLKIYKNRKKCSESIMQTILTKLEDPHLNINSAKKDDLADALLYALWAIRERCPSSLTGINTVEGAIEKMKPLKEEKRIRITV